MRHPARSLHHRHAVRSASTLGGGTAAECTILRVPRRPPEDLRLGGPRATVASTGSHWCTWENITAVIHQLHDGMQAWECMDDGELADWFEVTQRLRVGGVVPLLLSVFLAVVIDVTPV